MRAAIIGAGAIGTLVGALISKNNVPIDIIDANEEIVNVLNDQGATIKGYLNLNVPVNALTPDQMTGTYDVILLCIKQTANPKALPKLIPFLHKESIVCTLQNGIPEESVSAYVGKERTIGGAVGFGASWVEPGVTNFTSTIEVLSKYAFEIGELDGTITNRIYKIERLLSNVGKCNVLDNFMGLRWSKLLMNATFSGMSAALGCTFGDVLKNETALKCVAYIADETIKVAHSHGIKLTEMQGTNFETLEIREQQDFIKKFPIYYEVWNQHSKLKASMLQDLELGRKTEIDFINGYVSKKGKETGIPTPYNNMVVKIIKKKEQTGEINTLGFLERFEEVGEKGGEI